MILDEATRLKLLGELIEALQDNHRPHSDLDHLWVHFYTKRGRLVTNQVGADKALDWLFNNVYVFEEFDLREAHRLELHSH